MRNLNLTDSDSDHLKFTISGREKGRANGASLRNMPESTLVSTPQLGGGMAMVMAETKVRKTREGKPKSRNGCKTCKLRRVKCDETKPHCMRCTRFGQRCDGYILRTPSKASLQITTTRALAPRALDQSPIAYVHSERSSESPNATEHARSPPPNPSGLPSHQDYMAVDRFCEKSSKSISTLSSEKWRSFVHQACENSLSIQYAVTSIGSLDAAASRRAYENGVGTLQHQSAYGQYKQSSCTLQRAFGGELYDFRTTLTGCLLFFCFDGFQPCKELPVERVLLGLRELRDWASNLFGIGERKESPTRMDFAETESEIARAFRRMEVELMSHVDEKERLSQEEYLQMGRAGKDSMPVTFQNVEEARSSLQLVIRRSMYGLRSSMRIQKFSSESPNSRACQMPDFYSTDPRLDDREAILQEYKRWDDAFRPLLNFARSKGSSEENFLRASLLRLHWLSGFLSMSSNNSKPSIVNNKAFVNELEELIGISSLLLQKCKGYQDAMIDGVSMDQDSMFNSDMQIIVPIMTVGWTCRHRTLRQEAVDLLSKSSRREGAWDGVVIGKIMAWLAQMEEEGLEQHEGDERYIPEGAVVRGIRMCFDTERRIAMVSCRQPIRNGPSGEERERQTEIPW